MASQRAVAMRRADVTARLEALKTRIKEQFGADVVEQPVTNADAELAQVQRLENVAALLEAALGDALTSPIDDDSAPEVSATVAEFDDDGEDFALRLTEASGPTAAAALMEAGYGGAGAIAAATDEDLDAVKGVGPATVGKLREAFTE